MKNNHVLTYKSEPAEAIPGIPLYMDQVLSYLDDCLAPLKKAGEDQALTKTMINNYVKAKVLPPPVKKKYTKDHIMALMMLYRLKSGLQVKDITALFQGKADTASQYAHFLKAEDQAKGRVKAMMTDMVDLADSEKIMTLAVEVDLLLRILGQMVEGDQNHD